LEYEVKYPGHGDPPFHLRLTCATEVFTIIIHRLPVCLSKERFS